MQEASVGDEDNDEDGSTKEKVKSWLLCREWKSILLFFPDEQFIMACDA